MLPIQPKEINVNKSGKIQKCIQFYVQQEEKP